MSEEYEAKGSVYDTPCSVRQMTNQPDQSHAFKLIVVLPDTPLKIISANFLELSQELDLVQSEAISCLAPLLI